MKRLLLLLVMLSSVFTFTFAVVSNIASSAWWGGGWGGWYIPTTTTATTTIPTTTTATTTTKYYSWTWKIIIPAWKTKVISFSQELSEIKFSKSSDFTIMTLEWWNWQSLDNKLENYKPLKGYWVYNARWTDLVITYKVKPNISWADKLLQRKLYPGWNLIWISQPGVNKSYYKSLALGNLQFGEAIDFSNSNFSSTKDESYNSNFTVKSYSNGFDMFEWLWYGVFLSYNSYLPGVQDETTSTGAIKVLETTYTHTNPTPPHNGWRNYTCSKFTNTYDIKTQILDNGEHKYYYPNSEQNELIKVKYILSWDRINGFSGLVFNKITFYLTDLSTNEKNTITGVKLYLSWNVIWTWIINSNNKIIFSGLNYTIPYDTTWIILELKSDLLSIEEQDTYNFGVRYSTSSDDVEINQWTWIVYGKTTYTSNNHCSNDNSNLKDILWHILGASNSYNTYITVSNPVLSLINNYRYGRGIYQDIIWWETWVELQKFTLSAKYDNILLTGLYFTNKDTDSNISPSLNENVVSNLHIEDGSGNTYGSCVIEWWRIWCLNLTGLIVENNKSKELKLVWDFAEIRDASQTNKQFEINLTDIISKWKKSGLVLNKVWNSNINRTDHFNKTIWTRYNLKLRKAFLYFSWFNLKDTQLKEWQDMVIYKLKTRVKWEKVSLWHISISLVGKLAWKTIWNRLYLSWYNLYSKNDNKKILSVKWIKYNNELFTWIKYDFLCDNFRDTNCWISLNFSTWEVLLSWENILDILWNVYKVKEYDSINFNIWNTYYSDLSDINHTSWNSDTSNRSTDWFNVQEEHSTMPFPQMHSPQIHFSFDWFWKPKLTVGNSVAWIVWNVLWSNYVLANEDNQSFTSFPVKAKNSDIKLKQLRLKFTWDNQTLALVKNISLVDNNGNVLSTGSLSDNYVDFNNINYTVVKDTQDNLSLKISLNALTTGLVNNEFTAYVDDFVAEDSNWNDINIWNGKYIDGVLWNSKIEDVLLWTYKIYKTMIFVSRTDGFLSNKTFIAGSSNLNVMWATVQANNVRDLTINTVQIQLTWTASKNYISTAKLVVNGQVVDTESVNGADVTFNGLNVPVAKWGTQKLDVQIDTTTSITGGKTIIPKITNIGYVDADGNSYNYNTVVNGVTWTATPAASLAMTLNSNSPVEQVVAANPNVETEVARFDFRPTNDNAKIQELLLENGTSWSIVTGADSLISNVYVYDTNGNKLWTASLVNGYVDFNFANTVELLKDKTTTLIVKVQANIINSLSLTNKSVKFAIAKSHNTQETKVISESNWPEIAAGNITNTATSNKIYFRKTLLTFANNVQTTTALSNGSNDIYLWSATADQAGAAKIKGFHLDLSMNGANIENGTGDYELYINGSKVTNTNVNIVVNGTGSATTGVVVTLTWNYSDGYEISAASTINFKLVATNVSNAATNDSITVRLNNNGTDASVIYTGGEALNTTNSVVWSDEAAKATTTMTTTGWFTDADLLSLPINSITLTK